MTVRILDEKAGPVVPAVRLSLGRTSEDCVCLKVQRGSSALMSLVEVYEDQDGSQFIVLYRERAKKLGFFVLINNS